MSLNSKLRIGKFGGGGGGGSSELPKFAKDIAQILFRGPAEQFAADQGPHGLGQGIFGDINAGYNQVPIDQLFGGMGNAINSGQRVGQEYGDLSERLGLNGAQNAQDMAAMSAHGANDSAAYNRLNSNFLDQSGRAYNGLMNRLNNAPTLDSRNDPNAPQLGSLGGGPGLAGGYGVGTTGAAALKAANNVGPDSELYKSTLSFLRPQVTSSFSNRGMGGSGAAVSAEGDQARQLADSFAQRANSERNAFLQTAANSEGTAAGFQGARNNALANIYGSQAGFEGSKNNALANIFGSQAGITSGRNAALANIYGTQVQGGLGATEAPGRVFSTMQGGLGQGIQNIGNAAGQQLTPLQIAQAGLGGANAGIQTPINLQQMVYNYLRAPQSQLLGVPSSTGQQQQAGPRTGLLGNILGFDKGH
jgi:hypothetical protein